MRPTTGWTSTSSTRTAGDVDARLLVRMDEISESFRILAQLLGRLAPGEIERTDRPAVMSGEGAALVEAFRGDVFVSVRLAADGRLAHVHARDASWFQWPLLEAAVEGNIVADFPLCNKSFNCSYCHGHDPMRSFLLDALRKGKAVITPPAPGAAALEEVARRARRARRASGWGRSLAIREIDAGSCNGCELEIHAINNPVYDVERFGLKFVVASPCRCAAGHRTGHLEHARGAAAHLQRGSGTQMGRGAGRLRDQLRCLRRLPAVVGPLAEILPVDLHVPGCPPPPLDDREGSVWP